MSAVSTQQWDDYDREIVKAGQEVCQQLSIRFKLSRVSWRKWSPFLRVASDDCIFTGGRLVLPWWMRGRLKPSEWRPLMASSLIYNRRLVWTMPADLGFAIIMLVVLVIWEPLWSSPYSELWDSGCTSSFFSGRFWSRGSPRFDEI